MKREHHGWQMIVLMLLAAAMVCSLLVPEQLLDGPDPQRMEVSILIRQTESGVWSNARQGMEQAAEDLGAELRFLTLSQENDSTQQIQLLRRQAEMGVDAAVVVPADSQALAEHLADQRELPVVTMESPAQGAEAWVGPENETVGRLLAGQVIADLPAGSRVLLVNGCPGSAGVTARLESARARLEQAGFAPEVCTAADTETISGAKAVLCFDAGTLEQAVSASAVLEQPPRLYGAGVTDAIVAQLENGGVRALAAWSEYAQGYLAVSQAVAAARGEAPQDQSLPVTLVQEGETYDPEHQKLLYPVSH